MVTRSLPTVSANDEEPSNHRFGPDGRQPKANETHHYQILFTAYGLW